MPELPEVETVMCGLKPHLEGAIIQDVVVRHPHLRWPIPTSLKSNLNQQQISQLSRRGKYLLIAVNAGTLIIHLGMSGSLRIVTNLILPRRHDHVDIVFSDQKILRYHDPRRFGAVLWTEEDPFQHKLLASLGVEPLEKNFTPEYIKQKALGRRIAVKSFIMDSHIVVGVGNIYAAEALFLANIHPSTPSGVLTLLQCEQLVEAIQHVLQFAINQGGTTLKDFVNSEGKPGYFAQKLNVYGRAGLPCLKCQTTLKHLKLGQRSTVFCERCQSMEK
jgi:formamidopyrimidine-DNA glycosylase